MPNTRTRTEFPRVLQPLQQIFPSFRRHITRSSECRNICPQAVSDQASRPSILSILSIKERHLLSQAAVDTMVSSTTSLVGTVLDDVLTELREGLPDETLTALEGKVKAT